MQIRADSTHCKRERQKTSDIGTYRDVSILFYQFEKKEKETLLLQMGGGRSVALATLTVLENGPRILYIKRLSTFAFRHFYCPPIVRSIVEIAITQSSRGSLRCIRWTMYWALR